MTLKLSFEVLLHWSLSRQDAFVDKLVKIYGVYSDMLVLTQHLLFVRRNNKSVGYSKLPLRENLAPPHGWSLLPDVQGPTHCLRRSRQVIFPAFRCFPHSLFAARVVPEIISLWFRFPNAAVFLKREGRCYLERSPFLPRTWTLIGNLIGRRAIQDITRQCRLTPFAIPQTTQVWIEHLDWHFLRILETHRSRKHV